MFTWGVRSGSQVLTLLHAPLTSNALDTINPVSNTVVVTQPSLVTYGANGATMTGVTDGFGGTQTGGATWQAPAFEIYTGRRTSRFRATVRDIVLTGGHPNNDTRRFLSCNSGPKEHAFVIGRVASASVRLYAFAYVLGAGSQTTDLGVLNELGPQELEIRWTYSDAVGTMLSIEYLVDGIARHTITPGGLCVPPSGQVYAQALPYEFGYGGRSITFKDVRAEYEPA